MDMTSYGDTALLFHTGHFYLKYLAPNIYIYIYHSAFTDWEWSI
jgi:hypothetical protein